MTRNKSLLINALMVFSLLSPRAFAEEGKFTGEDFLKLHGEAKKFWLDGAISAFVHTASGKDKKIGKCIYDWYYAEDTAYKNGLIEASLKKYSNASPTSVLLALTEHACGLYHSKG